MSYFTSEIVCPLEFLHGLNELACLMGLSRLDERGSFFAGMQLDGIPICAQTFQTEEEWWSGTPGRTGVYGMIQCRDKANADGVPLSEALPRPEWDEEESLDMDALYDALQAVEVWEDIPDGAELPDDKIILYKGFGLASSFGIEPITD